MNKELIKNLKKDDLLYVFGQKKRWKVYFVNDKYVLLGKAMFGEYVHSIIDTETGKMSSGDSWQFGYYVTSDDFKNDNCEVKFLEYLAACDEYDDDVLSFRRMISVEDVEFRK